jgi:glycine/D-amino acid oxidase-like deaminating enzyme
MVMDRRSFLGLAVAAGLSPLAQACIKPDGEKLDIAIVGGGIVGACIAMYLARAGANVTLLEKKAPASGATSKSGAWINPLMDDPHYMKLRFESLDEWRALDKPLGLDVTWGGYVGFTDRESERGRMAQQARQLAAAGHPTRALDRKALKEISPEIDPGNLVEATFSDVNGHVDPVHVTERFVAAAKQAGARIIHPCIVTAIEPSSKVSGGVKLLTSQGMMSFDHVVVATGVDAPGLLAPLGYTLPLEYSPGALVHTKPMPIITRRVYEGPTPMFWKQMTNGRFVGLEASTPPKLPVHADIWQHPMEFPSGIAEMHGKRIISKLAVYTPALAKAEVDFMTLGYRPMPTDGFPVVGPVPQAPGVTLCVTHSGVTLAPALGRYMVSEIIECKSEPLLAPYRPSRPMPAAKSIQA